MLQGFFYWIPNIVNVFVYVIFLDHDANAILLMLLMKLIELM